MHLYPGTHTRNRPNQDGIKGVQDEIGQLKEGLVMERRKRHRKEVYEEHCKDINTYPPHRATKVMADG